MSEEEKETLFETSKRIGYKVGIYCNEEEIEIFEKLLEDYKYKNNLIQKQQEELEKKDKIIDEMAKDKYNNIDMYEMADMAKEIGYSIPKLFSRIPDEELYSIIKRYFKKKVERNSKRI